MTVRDIMTKSPACCDLNSNLQQVAQLMVQHDCGAIPVIDLSDSSHPAGIITDRDITTRCVAEGKNPMQMRASEIMSRSTITIREDGDLDHAAQLMKEHQVRRLIVVNDNRQIVGIVSQADLALAGSDEMTGEVVEQISEPSQRGKSR